MSPTSRRKSQVSSSSTRGMQSQLTHPSLLFHHTQAHRIYQALVHDAMTQIAIDAHDREVQFRRAEKMKQQALEYTQQDSTPPNAGPDIAQQEELEEGETFDDHQQHIARSASASTSPLKPSALARSDSSTGNGRAATGTPSRGGSGTPAPGAGAAQPSGSANLISSTYSANPLIRCLVCNRHVASNRYAPHLAKCMGLGATGSSKNSSGGLKRKAAAGAAAANAAAAAAAAAQHGGTASGANSPSSHGSGKARGRPPKYPKHDRSGTASARSTATPGL